MRSHLKSAFLYSLFLTCLVTQPAKACDEDACNIGTSAGCITIGTFATVATCAATLGFGCPAAAAITAGVCGSATAIASAGNNK